MVCWGDREDIADALGDPRLLGLDDVAFWRAYGRARWPGRSPESGPTGASAAAPVFAATLPLVLAYPAALRSRLLPFVAETLVAGGETRVAERLLAARPTDPDLALARAQLAEAQGAVDEALAQYDALAAGHDRLTGARAGDLATELRLRTGRLDAAKGADAMERTLYAWA